MLRKIYMKKIKKIIEPYTNDFVIVDFLTSVLPDMTTREVIKYYYNTKREIKEGILTND